jgi:hypothetical protein
VGWPEHACDVVDNAEEFEAALKTATGLAAPGEE